MPIERLTDARLRGLTHEDGEIIDAKSALMARADKTGTVTFTTRYRFGNKRPRIFLGTYPLMGLVAGRDAANRVQEQVRSGLDPQAERHAKRAASQLSFDELVALYLTRYAMKTKASWRLDQRHLTRDVSPHWAKRPAASILRPDINKLLFGLAERAPIGANRTKAILSKLFSWSVDNGLLDNNPMLGVKNPTREGRGKTRVLSDQEIRLLWSAVDTAEALPGIATALRLILVLGQRPGEVAGMAVDELHDLDDVGRALWSIPAFRMKARKGHLVPLPSLARELILTELARPRRSMFVFEGRFARQMARNSLSVALRQIIDGLDDKEGASLKAIRPTPHDLRRSAISGMSRIGVPRDDRMAVAAHSHGDVHEIYDRHDRLDEKRLALQRWQNYLRKVIAGEPGGAEIVPLRTPRGVS
jgi:integrase